MKTMLFAVCFLCATAAFGQSTGTANLLNSEPVVIEFNSHAGHATQTSLGAEQNLLGQSSATRARGERPLWEFPSSTAATPLGDSARMLKKEHEAAKKSEIVWSN
jgi:hypothetical protein